jgi:cell division protein FtsI/penicillin-binding protein 2
MASVAQTIASKGLRRPPTLIAGDAPAPAIRVTPARIARTVARLMIAVVQSGTGVAAAIPGVTVAGKTGTAELRDTTAPPLGSTGATGSNTDAWFAAYAPAKKPKLAVGVLFVKAGAGGQTAAPAAKIVLTAGLK